MAKKGGRKPYGYYPREAAAIELIRLKVRTRKGGRQAGPRQIAAELNAEFYKSLTALIGPEEDLRKVRYEGEI